MSVPISPWILAKIKHYKAERGYGFAYRDNNPQDIFIHGKMLRQVGFTGNLKPESLIEVQYIKTIKGLTAIDIRQPQRGSQ